MSSIPSGITDPNLAARYFPSNRINPGELVTTPEGGWSQLPTPDRPCIVWFKEHRIAATFAVASITIANAGAGYPLNVLLNATGGTAATPFQIQITRLIAATISAAAVAAGGTGYTNGDTLSFALAQGGTLVCTATVAAGAVTALAIVSGGSQATLENVTALPAVGGTGSGCTATLTATGSAGRVRISNPGDYTVVPASPVLTVSGAITLVPVWTALTWGATQPGAGRVIHYVPNEIPPDDDDSLRSRGAGVVYLPTPGRWYFKHKQDGGELIASTFIVIDAQDPALVARYLAEPGCHRVKTGTIVAGVANAQVVPGNRDRTGLLIVAQKNFAVANGTARLGFGTAADPSSGLLIGSDASPSLLMGGEQCHKGSVDIVRELTSVDATFSWVEWE